MNEQKKAPIIVDIHPHALGITNSFTQEMRSLMDTDLVSIAITGSCITGDYVPGSSDINSVVVLREITPSLLEALASSGKHFGRKRLHAPLLMTREYIDRSLDVFPVEFLDIKLLHKTVYGEDIFTDISINKSLLRLQCERDLKSKLINLHQGYISCLGSSRSLKTLLINAYPGFFPLFRAMLFITQISRPPSALKEDVLSDIESSFGQSLDAFREVSRLARKSGFDLDRNKPKDIFNEIYRITYELSLTMDRISS